MPKQGTYALSFWFPPIAQILGFLLLPLVRGRSPPRASCI